MRDDSPRWAHTGLVELVRLGQLHTEMPPTAWYSIVDCAEQIAAEERSVYVFEQHVLQAQIKYNGWAAGKTATNAD